MLICTYGNVYTSSDKNDTEYEMAYYAEALVSLPFLSILYIVYMHYVMSPRHRQQSMSSTILAYLSMFVK